MILKLSERIKIYLFPPTNFPYRSSNSYYIKITFREINDKNRKERTQTI